MVGQRPGNWSGNQWLDFSLETGQGSNGWTTVWKLIKPLVGQQSGNCFREVLLVQRPGLQITEVMFGQQSGNWSGKQWLDSSLETGLGSNGWAEAWKLIREPITWTAVWKLISGKYWLSNQYFPDLLPDCCPTITALICFQTAAKPLLP